MKFFEEELRAKEMRVMRDVYFQTGAQWRDVIREAISTSESVVVIWTPDSISDDWVKAEALCGWALQKPLMQARAFVHISDILEPLTTSHITSIGSGKDQRQFIDEIVESVHQGRA